MLQFIRNNTKGVVAWIIVILLIIPFALWGVNEYFSGGSGDVVVAKVGDRDIQLREFQSLYQRELAIRRQLSPANFDPSDPTIRRDVIDRLVNSETMSQTAFKAGFRVSDERLGQQIRAMREFQTNGRFDAELYDRLLRISGITRAQFEENLRRDLMMEQLIIGISETALLTGHELDRWLRLSEQQRRFGYLQLQAADFLGLVEVSEDEIGQYYRDNLDSFAVPERVRAEYVELSLPGLRDEIHVDDEQLMRMYEEQASTFVVGEERRVRHILLEFDQDEPEAAEEALGLANELRARIDAGESFADLAREYSADSGSATSGGDLGFIARGLMTGPFEDVAFALAAGETSAPVRTTFGIHLIRVDQIRPGTSRSFAEVRDLLEDEYRRGRADEQFFELTERLADLTFEHPDSLAIAAEELGLEILETDYLSRDRGAGIAEDDRFRQAAFMTDVFEAGNNSPVIELSQQRVVVLRIKDRQPASHSSLEEVRASISRELRARGAARLAEEEGRRLVERVSAGEGIAAVAAEHNLTWRGEVLARRDDPLLPLDVLDAVFGMQRPDADGARLEGIQLMSGDFAIVALQEVIDGDPATLASDERNFESQNIVEQMRQRETDSMLRALKDRLSVRIFEDRL